MGSQQHRRSTSSNSHPRTENRDVGFEPTGSQLPAVAQYVPVASIVPAKYQPRHYFDEGAMQELTASVREHGILQPLLVRPAGIGQYELVAGERRYKAAIAVGLSEVPVVVRELTDFEALQVALTENLHRGDLNAVEEAEGILQLLALHLDCEVRAVPSVLYKMKNAVEKQSESGGAGGAVPSSSPASEGNGSAEGESASDASRENVFPNPEFEKVKEVFAGLGKMTWESFIVTRLRLLKLPEDILEALRRGRIEYTKAKAIARIKDDEFRGELLEEAIAKPLSLSQIKERIRQHQAELKPSAPSLKGQIQSAYAEIIKSKVWDDPEQQEELSALLAQMMAVISRKSRDK
ncbi:ParB/RepB/Spo0J family partition protein [Kamptonema formosum]|uniref:ParB/RepB/Spo0J family partition protein n=1 Tax=Kamptonema formosum TaxID=331992 RepID=UPI00034A5468|nr:ParB/RepB/Spo0J family partition protein [Oscillatoria sp. PCC 10802]